MLLLTINQLHLINKIHLKKTDKQFINLHDGDAIHFYSYAMAGFSSAFSQVKYMTNFFFRYDKTFHSLTTVYEYIIHFY